MSLLNLFSYFDITIHHLPGKSYIIDALSHFSDLAALTVSVESSLCTQIHEV